MPSKAAAFQALHQRPQPFLIPNPWDAGTARLLAGLGFEALATTSLGAANVVGRRRATKQQILDNCRAICKATPLPVNADLENCFAGEPEEAARAIAEAFDCGAAGGSIEDATGNPESPIYGFSLAVERVHAAVEAARSLPVPFLLTARAESLLYGGTVDDAIRRLQAFEAAGADVLFAPGVNNLDDLRTLVSSVSKPVNMGMGVGDPSITLDQLAEIGVRRVSIGGALSRVAIQAFLDAAREMRDGRFTFLRNMVPIAELRQSFE
jgi:2-methylisocitrate lyase-like PEP mutase family enzyme